MTPARLLRSLAALAVLVALGACAERGGNAGTPRPSSPAEGPGRLLLQVEHVGGFLPPEALAGRLPLVSVYADGRIVVQGPQIAIYPGPALPNLQVWRLDEDGVRTVVDRAVAAGVTEDGDLGRPPVADAPSTRFTLATDAGTSVREVYALYETPDGSGLTPEQEAARGELRGLLELLGSPEGELGAAEAGSHRPHAVAALARPWTEESAPEPELAQPELAWPGPALPGEPLEPRLGLSCVVARGTEAEAVLAAAASATTLTPWTTPDGARWALVLRPLLPHEVGCTDLRTR